MYFDNLYGIQACEAFLVSINYKEKSCQDHKWNSKQVPEEKN